MAATPIYVITGFLGAGKTTALNAALKEPELARTAVLVNEFGETSLDHLFFEAGSNVVELANGCVCCTIRGELADTLLDLPLDGIDRVVIETTGLADPVPILQMLTGHPELQARFRFSGMIAFADCLNVAHQSEKHSEARRQIALADAVLITKLDMVPDDARIRAETDVKVHLCRLNKAAPIEAVVSSSLVSLLMTPAESARPALPDDQHNHSHKHETHGHSHNHASHHQGIETFVLRHKKPIAYKAMEAFCELLTSAHADTLLRIKGIVSIAGEAQPLAVHCVGGVMHEPQWLPDWPTPDHSTRIVVIVDGLEADFVERLFAGFMDIPVADTPDSAAMTDNPLAVPGHKFG